MRCNEISSYIKRGKRVHYFSYQTDAMKKPKRLQSANLKKLKLRRNSLLKQIQVVLYQDSNPSRIIFRDVINAYMRAKEADRLNGRLGQGHFENICTYVARLRPLEMTRVIDLHPTLFQAFLTCLSVQKISTERRGQSGVGLEAQKGVVNRWLGTNQHEIVSEHIEIESGRRDDRPELAAAIKDEKKAGATLVIAKLDRLARDIHTNSRLMRSGVKFVAVDNPHANELTVHLLPVMAEHEAKQISERTKAALKAAKARGVKLGAARTH